MFFGFCLEETIWSERDGLGFGMNETGAAMGLDGHARASSRVLQMKATRAAAELVVSR
jgi:hypothetical protein